MQGILPLKQLFTWAWTAILVFSFCTAGCHPLEDAVPLPQATVKNEKSNTVPVTVVSEIGYSIARSKNGSLKKSPETSSERDASGILLPEKKAGESRLYVPAPDDKNPDAAGRRDPFALPAALRKQLTVTQGKGCFTPGNNHFETPLKKTAVQQSATPPAPGSRQPYVAGFFDSGKDKLALLHWKQIQGAFRRGESLGNGYYVKEITAATVLLYPEKSASGMKPVTLTLQQ